MYDIKTEIPNLRENLSSAWEPGLKFSTKI